MNLKFILLLFFSVSIYLKSQSKGIENIPVPLFADNKWGWADLFTKKTLIEPIYDSVDYKDNIGYLVYKEMKFGNVDCKSENKCIVNFSNTFDNKINTEKLKFLDDPNLIGYKKLEKDDVVLMGDHNFENGNYHQNEKFKIEKTTLLNSNQYFDNYLIVKNRDGNKYGMIETYKDSIILDPEYDDIKIIKRIHDYFVIAQKGSKLSLIFKDKRVSKNEYDEICYNETQDLIVLKKNNLYGFVLFQNKNTFHPEVRYTDENKFVVFEPKYIHYKNSKYSSGYYLTCVLNVTDTKNRNYYISNLGFEYIK